MTMFYFPDPPPIFPDVPHGYSVKLKPQYASKVQTSCSGFEQRSSQQVYPLWDFELTFEVLRDSTQNVVPDSRYANFADMRALCGLFLACRGQYGRFFYSCPEDNSRLAAAVATADGVQTVFPVSRQWAAGLPYEPVWLDTTRPFTIFNNGANDTSNWTVTDNGATITRGAAPAAGHAITANFFFFYLCRFLEDVADFDQFYSHLWEVKALKFRSVKGDQALA